uniref:Uncharacterized protein n=1 Tax=Panagrolaimus davidi TaxID=227884 RepID=A0A914PIV0_9BILA
MENKLHERSDSDLLEQKTVEYVEERLRYPHENMNENLIQYECLSSNPIPQSLIEKSKEMYNLYQQIKEANDDYEEWIQLLSSVNDHEFLKNTVEIRIGKNLTDKKLWKAYIKYLESYNVKEMLQVYSKYCRFFLDDVEMLKEYLEKGKQHGSIEVIWKPQYSFERQCIRKE